MSNELHFGVSVGIDRYPEFTDLRSARLDAKAFADWLLDDNGGNLPDANVELIIAHDDQMPADTLRENAVPVRTRVYDEIQNYWKQVRTHIKEHPEDWFQTRLYFYVSGHGIGPETTDAALLMANAGPDNYGENISCRELIEFLGQAQYFAEVVVFADCCRDRPTNVPLGKPPWTLATADNGEVKTLLGVASDFGSKAYEIDAANQLSPDDFRSYYTKALLEGLYGKEGQARENGELNTRTLADYAKERVRELLKDSVKKQECHHYSDLNNPIVLARGAAIIPTTNMPKLNIVFETDFRGVAILYDGDKQELERKQIDGANTRWPVELKSGLYQVVPAAGADVSFKNDGYFAVVGGVDVVI